jgi:single-strand DNA-binding protein
MNWRKNNMLNRVVLIGRLTKDVEMRYTPNGNATCSFTLACERQMKNSQGEKEVDFLNVNVPPFRAKLAELCANYLSKGKLAAVDGAVQVRSFDGNDGKKVYITEIIAEAVRFLSPRDDNEEDTPF